MAHQLPRPSSRGKRIVGDGRQVGLETVAQHEDMFATTEWVLEHGHRTQQYLGVITRRLTRARTVKISAQVCGQHLGLARPDPPIHTYSRVKAHVLVIAEKKIRLGT